MRPVSQLWSRLLVGGALLPVVLYVVWLGGWWLFGLAFVAGLVALHELYAMTRSLRPLVLGGYAGLAFTLVGAELGGASWLVAGVVHRMAPTISPGKTWEGFIAGTVTAVAVCFFALYKQHFLSSVEAVALGAAVAVTAALGDLFESAVKRDLGVKDSGRILGGHGGMLDRIDAQLFAVPAAYVIVLAFGHA